METGLDGAGRWGAGAGPQQAALTLSGCPSHLVLTGPALRLLGAQSPLLLRPHLPTANLEPAAFACPLPCLARTPLPFPSVSSRTVARGLGRALVVTCLQLGVTQ